LLDLWFLAIVLIQIHFIFAIRHEQNENRKYLCASLIAAGLANCWVCVMYLIRIPRESTQSLWISLT